MRIEPNSMQLRLAGVYGSPQATRPVQATPSPEIGRTDPSAGDGASLRGAQAMRLVAGVVPGGIDFSGDTPQPRRASLPLYRHPADRNAAATGVELGRTVDFSG